MFITWDEPKRLANLVKHGLDFADLGDGFFADPLLTGVAYGRFKGVNQLEGEVVVVIFSLLGTEAISIISLRRANKKESRFLMPKREFVPGRGYTKEDWDAVDSPPLTDAELASLRPFAEVFPELAAAIKRGRGKQKAPTKRLVSLRLDQDALSAFKASGPGWQGRINDVVVKAARELAKPAPSAARGATDGR